MAVCACSAGIDMTQDDLKLVLEALKWCHGGEPCGTAEAIAVVEKALAQPEQWGASAVTHPEYVAEQKRKTEELRSRLAQPKQEPVAWARYPRYTGKAQLPEIVFNKPDGKDWLELYTHAPQRTWVGLTDEEIEVLFQTAAGADEEVHIRFARAIEAKLKDKNCVG